MRVVHATALTVAALLLTTVASAQGIGDVAAKEKQKRKAAPAKPAKVYTEGDVGSAMAPVSATPNLPASSPATDGKATAESGGAPATDADKAEKEAAEARAKAEADWHTRLDQARKEESAYQDTLNKVQLALNDTSNLYNPGRAANVNLLEDTKKKLAEVQSRIAALEQEGRSNNYR